MLNSGTQRRVERVEELVLRERQSIGARPGTGAGQNSDRRLIEMIEVLLVEIVVLNQRLHLLEKKGEAS